MLQHFNEQSMEFLKAVVGTSGLGEETYLPEGGACQDAAALHICHGLLSADASQLCCMARIAALAGSRPVTESSGTAGISVCVNTR